MLNFRSYELKAGQKLEVFTGPGENYYRCANGKAGASTNEKVRIAGREKGWIAVEYETNGGSWRIGYTLERKLKDKLDLDELELYYDSGVIVENCAVTDEPDGSRTALATLSPGAEVTLLGPYTDGKNGDWAYVDVQTNAGLIRGFVPVSCVSGSPASLILTVPIPTMAGMTGRTRLISRERSAEPQAPASYITESRRA